uniref:F-box associated domain-containing protein n=1 Tax=Tanacetum cinerariifolium TaxID=118510 RepID=A0A6L2NKQ3_TANCI|nr:hypothetical protein [Tanacetum cinerariifolium]
MVVWNPSIRKSVDIVIPDDDPPKPTTLFAFAVCPVSSDPTVVKVSYGKINNVPSQSIRLDLSIHLSTGRVYYSSTHVAIDMFIYWVAYDNSLPVDDHRFPTIHMLLSFDMISNQFEEVVFPDSLANLLPVTVSKLRESLVVLEFNREIDENAYGLWMMKHGNDGIRSFTKLYIINTHESIIVYVLGKRNSGQLIIETQNDVNDLSSQLDVYEPSSQNISNFGICGRDESFFMAPYMETLLLLDHSDCCIYSSN